MNNWSTAAAIEHRPLEHDLDAAHARLRSHQHTLEHIDSRIAGNERRIDRLEQRIDDQNAALSEMHATMRATQNDVHSQKEKVDYAADRVAYIVSRLDGHIEQEIKQEHDRTQQMERLHRTIIRGVTVLAVVAIGLIVVTQQTGLLESLMKLLG